MRMRRTLESHKLQIQCSLSVGAFYNFCYKTSKTVETSVAYISDLCPIVHLQLQAHDQTGEVFPIWAECLGLELLALLIGERDVNKGQYDESLFSLTDARNISLRLELPSGN